MFPVWFVVNFHPIGRKWSLGESWWAHTSSMVGFTVDPDQWCRHDRGQAWPGSSAPYRHLPHHRAAGGARPERAGGLSGSEPGAGPLPSTPRTFCLSRPRWGRPSGEPHGEAGGRVSHWGETTPHSHLVGRVFLDVLVKCCRNLIDASFSPLHP